MTRYEALDPTLDNGVRKLRAEWDTTPIGSGSYMQWLEAQVAGLRRDSSGAVSALRIAEHELSGREDFDPDVRVEVLRMVREAIAAVGGRYE